MKRLWLVLLLLVAGGVPAKAERLQPRLDEVRWRLAGYVKAGILQSHELAMIEEMVVNEEYEVVTIPAGTPVSNWCTPKPGAKAFQFRPGKYVTPYPIKVAVFRDERLVKTRVFMIGKKRCFNFVGGWCPPEKKEPCPPPVKPTPPPKKEEPPPPPPCKGVLEICKKLTGKGGELAGHQFRLLGPGGLDITLTTDISGVIRKGDLPEGEYTLLEVPREHYVRREPQQMQYRFRISRERVKEVVMAVNEYCSPVVKVTPPPPKKEVSPPRYEASTPPPEEEQPRPPGRVSGYFPGRPFREVRESVVGHAFLYSRPKITSVNKRIVRKEVKPKPDIPPGDIPLDVGQPGDPRSGRPPRGRITPGN